MSSFGLNKTNLIGFTPPLLGGCVQWLHTNRGLELAGAKVFQWTDLSGRGNHCTNDIDATRPTVNATGINSLPTIEFNGVLFLTHSLTVQPPCTVVFVAKRTNTTANYQPVGSWSASGINGVYVYIKSNAVDEWGSYSNGDSLSGQSVTSFKRCVLLTRAYNDMDLRTNGSSVTRTTGVSGYNGGAAIGFTGGTQSLLGEIAEIIIFNRVLLVAECQKLESYLSLKYAL